MEEVTTSDFNRLWESITRNRALADRLGITQDVPLIGFDRSEQLPRKEIARNLNRMVGEIVQCRRCELGVNRIRRGVRAVPGEGHPQAIVAFIGETPGKEEERPNRGRGASPVGRPFVGRSGQLLDRVIEYLGLKREQVFISNTTKCRSLHPDKLPPEDTPPLTSQVQACMPYLHDQLGLIQPWLIVCLGKSAATAILEVSPTSKMTELKSQIYDYPRDPRIKVWVAYHPSFILRNMSQELIPYTEDFRVVRAILRKAIENARNR